MTKLFSRHDNKTFTIEEDLPGVGFYVYAYDVDGRDTHDFLQDNLDMAKRCALCEFGVPLNSWIIAPDVIFCFCGNSLSISDAFQLTISSAIEAEEVQGAFAHKACLNKTLHEDFIRHPQLLNI